MPCIAQWKLCHPGNLFGAQIYMPDPRSKNMLVITLLFYYTKYQIQLNDLKEFSL